MARKESFQRGRGSINRGEWTLRYWERRAHGEWAMCRKKLGLAATASKKEALKLAESLMSRINDRNSKPSNRSKSASKSVTAAITGSSARKIIQLAWASN